jgi:glycosyltransferase involved in cell wall biosynthesis
MPVQLKNMQDKKLIVVSGINLYTGGTLKIMQDCLAALSAFVADKYRIIALVYNENLYPEYANIQYISFPKSRKSWFYRLYYEYIGFKKLSKQWKPYLWFALHDTTPNVYAERKAVYCHNSFPFFHVNLKCLFLQPNIYLISVFTLRFIYKPNIRTNNHVIVQQEWMRKAFRQIFGIDNIVVALPHIPSKNNDNIRQTESRKGKATFFYPAGPVINKNFELICEAVALLEKINRTDFEVILTISGKENKYTQFLLKKYSFLKQVRFEGFLKREDMDRYYREADCLIFPSKVETWGLPITEAKEYNLPILVANLPYAKESVGKYGQVKFFDPDNAIQLSELMKGFISGSLIYDHTEEIQYEQPFTRNWEELFKLFFSLSNE